MSGDPDSLVKAIFNNTIAAHARFADRGLPSIVAAAQAISRALGSGRKLLAFGNGGSAGDAEHLVADLVGRFEVERRALPAVSLTCDPSVVTAIANDYDYAQVFAKQVQALGKPEDIAIAISTSGNSPNVLAAIEACKKLNISTIGLTGGSGGKMIGKVDYMLCVTEGKNSPRIQETHILVGHVICDIVDQKLFPGI